MKPEKNSSLKEKHKLWCIGFFIVRSAIDDIQEAIDYYDEQQAGLGVKFESELNNYLHLLAKSQLQRIRGYQFHF